MVAGGLKTSSASCNHVKIVKIQLRINGSERETDTYMLSVSIKDFTENRKIRNGLRRRAADSLKSVMVSTISMQVSLAA